MDTRIPHLIGRKSKKSRPNSGFPDRRYLSIESAPRAIPKQKENEMSLGAGIVLFVIGAILVFATDIQLDFLNLDVVGYILMIAGIVGVILGLVVLTRRRGTVASTRSATDPVTGDRVTHSAVERDPLV
jgi:hypothetical protein